MRFRNTILAFLVLAGLGVFIYYYEYQGEDAREAKAESEANALSFENDKVRAIEITKPQADVVRVSRDAEGWMLESPLKTRADADKVSSLLSGLGLVRIEKKLEGIGEGDLGEFKLKEPAARVKLTMDEAAAELTLDLGDKTPIGGEYYARRPGATDVLLVSGDVSRILSADAVSLRYKKLVGVDSWKVEAFTIEKGAESVGFVRGTGGEDWRLEKPMSFPADGTKVQGLWMDLQSAEASGFESENASAADLQRLGLDKPGLTLTVRPMIDSAPAAGSSTTTGAKPPVRVILSVPNTEGTVYARRDDIPAVMTIGKETYEKLSGAVADPSAYRDHRAAPVDRWKLSMIEIQGASGVVRLFKSDEDSSWHRESVGGEALAPEQANALIDAIDAIKASGYIDGAAAVQALGGARTPLTITVQEGSGETARTVWMKVLAQGAGANADSTQRRVTSSASSSIYLVPAAAVQTLLDQASSLAQPGQKTLEPALPAAQPGEAKKP